MRRKKTNHREVKGKKNKEQGKCKKTWEIKEMMKRCVNVDSSIVAKAPLPGGVEVMHGREQGLYGKSLCCPLSSAVNLKLL